jgi:hypothetical protein
MKRIPQAIITKAKPTAWLRPHPGSPRIRSDDQRSSAPNTSKPATPDVIPIAAIEQADTGSLRPYPGNPRTHSRKQVRQIAESIRRFGFTNPVLIGGDGEIIAGHGRVEAARLLGLESVPTVRLAHLDAAQRRAYVLADNKLALNAGWDRDLLAIELQGLINLEFDIELTGFSAAEIDIVLDEALEGSTDGPAEPEDQVPQGPEPASAVTRPGDVWCLGRHRLICGDARDRTAFAMLMGDERADLVFTDPPDNVPIDGYVTGLGRIRHREFAMGVGEMSAEAFAGFLRRTLGNAAKASRSGAIAFVCMDWRHMGELLEAGQAVFSELKNLCVWNKTNGGMGTFYRSKHELVFVFKVGTAAHTNTFGLGDSGRYRTNVWDFAGVNSMRAGRDEDLDASVLFPPHVMASAPGRAILAASHTTELAEKWGRRVRNLVAQHGATLGSRLSDDNRAAGRWELDNGGEYYAAGVGAAIVGFRADGAVIDDPVRSREDADSECVRDKIWDWYKSDLLTRLRPGGWVILIQTRWHEDDLAGRIIAEMARGGEAWDIVSLPAEAEAGDLLGRAPGEWLWDDAYGYAGFLRREKATQLPRNWSALYQQRPAPETGDYFKEEWLRTYASEPPRATLNVYGGSDYAVTSDGGDYTVHVVVGVDPDNRMYLLDLWRGQTSSDVWIEAWCDLVRNGSQRSGRRSAGRSLPVSDLSWSGAPSSGRPIPAASSSEAAATRRCAPSRSAGAWRCSGFMCARVPRGWPRCGRSC